MGDKIVNTDRVGVTRLFAQAAADASDIAVAASGLSVVNRAAADKVAAFKRNKLDQPLRTGGNTHSARAAEIVVHNGDAVADAYCAELAASGTGAEPDTAVRTQLVPAAERHG